MKIAKIELFKVAPRWLFLKMTTDDGLVAVSYTHLRAHET